MFVYVCEELSGGGGGGPGASAARSRAGRTGARAAPPGRAASARQWTAPPVPAVHKIFITKPFHKSDRSVYLENVCYTVHLYEILM